MHPLKAHLSVGTSMGPKLSVSVLVDILLEYPKAAVDKEILKTLNFYNNVSKVGILRVDNSVNP